MANQFKNLSGFVLAGGKSRRMGQDKQTLILEGETLISRQMRLVRSVCGSVAVVGGLKFAGELDLAFYEDELPGHGPLGGIYTGLLRTRTEYNLFVSCDAPLITKAFLRYLCQRALGTGADVTVPESENRRLQPLCAIYRRRMRAAIRSSLARDENKASAFYSLVRCKVIRWHEISRAGFHPQIFINMNTPEDYEVVKKAAERRGFALHLANAID